MTTVLVLMILMAVPTAAQETAEDSVWTKTQLADHIWKLNNDGSGFDVKVIVSVGSDGILIVDSGQKRNAEALKAALQELGGLPRIIINTHSHVEHLGGNAIFEGEPIVIGHVNLRDRLTTGSFLFDEFGEETLPDITFVDSLTIHFNGEDIKLAAFPGAHDNSDIVIWFTDSKVACVGALSNGSDFPSVDGTTGDVKLYPEMSGRVLDMLPEDTKIIPGHGADGTMADFRKFHEMLVSTADVICNDSNQEKDLESLQAEQPLKDWESYGGSYTSVDRWVQYLFDGCLSPESMTEKKEEPWEEMYYTIKQEGTQAAIELYHRLKETETDKYEFSENFPLYVGYKLYTNDKAEPALDFFELAVTEYPEAQNCWMSHYFAAKVSNDLGDKTRATKHIDRALELNPDSQDVKELAEEIRKD